MCGFCGIYDPTGSGRFDRDQVQQMTRLMAERGPDEEGTWFGSHVALGHRRLTIIGLEAGEQPVFNEDRSILVAFNGEIYNYRAVRAMLEAAGHRFYTDTDTEVIVHAWEEFGEACLTHFRGMFAFALHDTRTGQLLIARDRMGIKPLYYAVEGGRLLFASEIKPVLLALGKPVRANPEALDLFMSSGYVAGELTLFDGVRKLQPGYVLELVDGAARSRPYWDLPDVVPTPMADAEAEERLAALLRESVDHCMVSDVPIGAFLSGGVDSSVVVSNMAALSPGRVKTYALGFEDSAEHNELAHARRVAALLGTDHTEHILRSEDFFENLLAFVRRTEEPIVDASGIAMYHLARRARQDVKVVLSGEGGDELLSGYAIYRTMERLDRSSTLRQLTGVGLAARLLAPHVTSEKAAKYLDWIGSDLASTYRGVTTGVTPSLRPRIYAADFAAQVGDAVSRRYRDLYAHLRHGDSLRRMAYVDFKSWLPDNQLVKTDKMTMAASLELRVPLLDHKLVEFCMTLPSSFRIRDGVGKYLLKRVAQRTLPRDLVHRRKQGFPTPIAQWFRGELYERIRELLLDPRSRQRGYFRPGYVEQILERHRTGKEDLSQRILTFVMLELWHRTFVDDALADSVTRHWTPAAGAIP